MFEAKDVCLIDSGFQENGVTLQLRSQQQDGEFVLLVFDKTCTLVLNHQKYRVQPFMFLLYPFEQQKIHVSGSSELSYHWMHLRLSAHCVLVLEKKKLCVKQLHVLRQPIIVTEMYELLQYNMTSVLSEERKLLEEIRFHALQLLLCLLTRDTNVDTEKIVKIPHYEKLIALRKEIYLHPAENWRIEEICKKLSISRPYFHKIYQSAFETTCTQDVIQARLTYSKRLLKNSDAAIAEVSQQCGFETDVYFMRQFKRHVGMTPTAYRRLCRQQVNEVPNNMSDTNT